MSRCNWRRRPIRRGVDAWAISSSRLFRSASVDTSKASSRASRPRGEAGAGALRSSERSAGVAPLSLSSAGVDEPRSPTEVAPPPPPPQAATPPLSSSVVPGSGVVTPPRSRHLHPPYQEILAVLRIGIAIVHDPCHGHGHLGGGAQKTATCLLYTSPSPRDLSTSRMPSSA